LEAHNAETAALPRTQLADLEKQDFAQAVKLRLAIDRFDANQPTARRQFLEESAALTAGCSAIFQNLPAAD